MLSLLHGEKRPPIFNSSSYVTGSDGSLEANKGGQTVPPAQPAKPTACYHPSMI